MCILLVLFCACAYSYIKASLQQEEYSNEIKRIKEHVTKQENDEINTRAMNFEELKRINPDIVGWIMIPDTNIDYPIVKGSDNQYYLTHTYGKQKNYMGSIFMDYRQDFSMLNVFIYGHNVVDGFMFRDLEKYKEQQFYDSHSTVYLYKEDGLHEMTVVSFFQAKDNDKVFMLYREHDTAFEKYLEYCERNSYFPTTIQKNKFIVSLVTCSYESGKGLETDLRYVLQLQEKE